MLIVLFFFYECDVLIYLCINDKRAQLLTKYLKTVSQVSCWNPFVKKNKHKTII